MLNIRTYIVFTLFSAPIIDILNGVFVDVFPIGQIIRTLIIVANFFIIFKKIPRKNKNAILGFFVCVIYLMLHALFTGVTNDVMFSDLNFAMKPVLFLSQLLLLENCIIRGIINWKDFFKFWKYSSWFLPISIILMVLFNVSETKGGYYASVNAVSMILVVNIVFCLYFSQEKITYWLGVAFNFVSIVCLGTKSPYLFLVAIFLTLIFFNSKQRVILIVMGGIAGSVAIFLITNYFSEQLSNFFEYHTYHISKAIENNDWSSYLFSGRNNMFLKQWTDIKSSEDSVLKLLFGIGRSNFITGVEMDFFELVFAFGAVVPIFIYSFFAKGLKHRCTDKNVALFMNIAVMCTIGFSVLGGHVLLEAIGGMYASILLATKYSLCEEFYKQEV
jgi:hypothetical protein